jgi:hypothetical protein
VASENTMLFCAADLEASRCDPSASKREELRISRDQVQDLVPGGITTFFGFLCCTLGTETAGSGSA